ncbi:hypothetical protein MICAK_3090018 [Microcystis aeruginosa PCC 9701]|uniref:Uncharacterized protein n=1 Tax=Microcystis aeruginosa PCC 9701 TaxID=721123 RepID=I4IS99_MICAE|nr:hypothetical protein MICAK_3090018 [Microcystis aeruginosa PCC 9701]
MGIINYELSIINYEVGSGGDGGDGGVGRWGSGEMGRKKADG